MRRYTEKSTCSNCRHNGKNDQKFSGILIMSPEGESKIPGNDKMYKIYEENPPWVVKTIRATNSSLPEKQVDWKMLEGSSSQDSFMSVSSEEIDSCHSNVSVKDSQDIINEKITQFLEWGIKESIQKQLNESYPGSLNPVQSQHRLLSGLDENDQDYPGDETNNIEKTNSCHVNWNEYVECYRYPVESSVSTIDVKTYPLKTEELIRTRSQPNLSDDYNTNPNNMNIKQSNSDVFWNDHTNHTNSYKHQTNSTHVSPCLCKHHRHSGHLYSHSNMRDEQSDFNRSKKYTEWHEDDSNMNRTLYYHNNLETQKPYLNSQNDFDSFVFANADELNNSSNSYQCSTSTKLSVEKHRIKDQKINQHTLDNFKSDRIKKTNNCSENIKSKKDVDCHLCGKVHSRDENSDDSKMSIKSRNTKLRQLLGLKPDEKNVLVMLKL